MTAQEYITRLKQLLKRLPHDEYNEAINYYEQYFADGGEIKESPEQVAKSILADFAVSDKNEKSEKKPMKSGTKIWIIILSIFSFPILFPLGITLFALAIALFAVVFSLFVAGIVIIISGVIGFFVSLALLFINPFTAIFFMGWLLISVALGLLFIKGTIYIAKKLANWILDLSSRILRRNKNE